jgi:hypothetical protein
MFDDVKKLIEDFKAGKYTDVVRDAAHIQIKLADFVDDLLGGAKFAFEREAGDAAIAELQECINKCSEKGAPVDEKNMDPATIALIIGGVVELLKLLQQWRKKRQEQ